MAEYTLSVKTESTAELADIVAKLNGVASIQTVPADGIVKEAIRVVADGQTHTADISTPVPTPAPVPVSDDNDGEQNTNAPTVDKNNLPWDGRIHAGTKALNADGTWKKRRGVDDATIAAVTAELTGASVPQPETPAPTPQPETPAPVPTPAPVTETTVKAPIQQFQEIVATLVKAGQEATPDYMQKYQGQIVQFLLKKSGVANVPSATADQMKAMYDTRDKIIANMASIAAGVPVESLV